MVEAGADLLVAHVGLTTKGAIGAQTALSLEEAAARVQTIADAARFRRSRCAGAVPRRPDRRTGGRGVRDCADPRHRRVLWGLQC